jgi:hypothetical protein
MLAANEVVEERSKERSKDGRLAGVRDGFWGCAKGLPFIPREMDQRKQIHQWESSVAECRPGRVENSGKAWTTVIQGFLMRMQLGSEVHCISDGVSAIAVS